MKNSDEHKTLLSLLKKRINKLSQKIQTEQKKLSKLSLLRLGIFSIIGISIFIYYTSRTDNHYYLLIIGLEIITFVFLIFYYRRIEVYKNRLIAYDRLLKRETNRSQFKLETLYDYDVTINSLELKNHFHRDLGISGKNGLFTYLNTTKTINGEKIFLENLLRIKRESTDEIVKRQSAIKTLSQNKNLCFKILRIFEEAHLEEVNSKINLAPLYSYQSKFFEKQKILSRIYQPYIILGWLVNIYLFLAGSPSISASLFIINTILFIINRKEISHLFKSFKNIEDEIPSIERLTLYLYGSKIQFNDKNTFSNLDKNRIKNLYKKLSSIIGRVSVQNAPLMHYTLNMLFLWDLWQLTSFSKWQKQNREIIQSITDDIYQIDSILPFAFLKFHNPGYTFPTLDEKLKTISAQNMGHPLIPERNRINNPLQKIKIGESLIITGSNMSGKTTYLRTVGINAILALCGSPVAADKMDLPPLHILSSIKNEDSLEEGISFFYSEVKRIAHILNQTKEPGIYLILLDELLKGTNTRERLIASRAILKKLASSNSIIFITTHDVDLAIKTTKQKVAHFTETIEENKMSFDYKIKDGVIKSTNALKILEIENLDLDF
ncbi:MAG TPA: hypothetical protein PLM36_12945 [Leptospiraceae bacterium]|nr:hypothetical protein [Leptospiraceae bacterium]HMY31955.1 hypothetical protein [Leptospiraceae bacterium]